MLNITRALRNKKKKNERRSASAVEPMLAPTGSMIVQAGSLSVCFVMRVGGWLVVEPYLQAWTVMITTC